MAIINQLKKSKHFVTLDGTHKDTSRTHMYAEQLNVATKMWSTTATTAMMKAASAATAAKMLSVNRASFALSIV
ncbi:hypothetical protein TYRP_001960 [Tyrophagus putrescentiae]|nr:hypothetical protein TYRP_001960 [Tyrophagus putrescentiae]